MTQTELTFAVLPSLSRGIPGLTSLRSRSPQYARQYRERARRRNAVKSGATPASVGRTRSYIQSLSLELDGMRASWLRF